VAARLLRYSSATPLPFAARVGCSWPLDSYLANRTWAESEYQDRLELKSGRDRTLGVGVADGDADGALFLLTASALLRVSLDVEKVVKFDPEYAFPACEKAMVDLERLAGRGAHSCSSPS
jgi:hypothetical protein